MPSINAIRIRRYNRLCKRANSLHRQAKHRGQPPSERESLARLERLMEGLSERSDNGPRR